MLVVKKTKMTQKTKESQQTQKTLPFRAIYSLKLEYFYEEREFLHHPDLCPPPPVKAEETSLFLEYQQSGRLFAFFKMDFDDQTYTNIVPFRYLTNFAARAFQF